MVSWNLNTLHFEGDYTPQSHPLTFGEPGSLGSRLKIMGAMEKTVRFQWLENGPGLKMYLLLKMVIFHCHVSLPEGKMGALVVPTNFITFRS